MSGHDRVKFNTRERGVSSDLNLLQQNQARAVAEVVRAQVSDLTFPFWASPGRTARATGGVDGVAGVGLYLAGDVISGLLVRPDASGYLLVDSGVLSCYSGAIVESGDSSFTTIASPGVTSTTALPFVPNAAGSARWDIVECQPAADVVVSESRDIYNTATQNFAPATVEKFATAQLAFRYRVGTAGSGVPLPDANWLPLAAVQVQPGATGFGQCDVYDIRPLVSERTERPNYRGILPGQFPECRILEASAMTNPDWLALTGAILADGFGYYAGGVLRRSTPTSIAEHGTSAGEGPINLSHVGNRSAAVDPNTFTDNLLVVLAAHFPRGYPRWVRYSQTGTPRYPSGPRGLVWLVEGSACLANGVVTPVSAPPSICALGSEIPYGVALCHVTQNYNDGVTPAPFQPFSLVGRRYSIGWQFVQSAVLDGPTFADAANSSKVGQFVAGTHFPKNAKTIRIRVAVTPTITAGPKQIAINARASVGGAAIFDNTLGSHWDAYVYRYLATGVTTFIEFDVPVIALANPEDTGGSNFYFGVSFQGTATFGTTKESAVVIGWEY